MLLIFDPRIEELMIKHLGFNELRLVDMKRTYREALEKIQVDELFQYIEENNLEEESQFIDSLCEDTDDRSKQVENLERLYTYIFECNIKHPQYRDRVEQKIRKINQDLIDTLFDNLPAEAMAEIAAMFVDDINIMLTIKKANPSFELPERLNQFVDSK